jgi:hypothetical protein
MLRIVKAFLPKSTTDKIDCFPSGARLLDSDFGLSVLRREKLPAFLGGGVADADLPRELTGELVEEEADSELNFTCVHVAARAAAETKVSVPAPAAVEFQAFVEHYGVLLEVRCVCVALRANALPCEYVCEAEEEEDEYSR